MREHRPRLGLLALLGGATGIGFAPLLVRWSETGPSATAFWRLVFALPLLWLWAAWDQRSRPTASRPETRRDFTMLALAGLCFTGDLSLWHWSLQYTSVANSTLLANVAPVFVAIGAWLFLGDRISGSFIIGMALAFAGATLLVRNSAGAGTQHLLGDVLAILAALFYAGYMLIVKRLRERFSTATIMAWSGLSSCAGFGIVAWLSGDVMLASSSRGWMVLLGLALVSHVGGQTLIAYGFGHLPAGFSALSLLWQPVVSAAVAWLFLGERLTWLQGAGALVVLTGIAIAGGTVAALRRNRH